MRSSTHSVHLLWVVRIVDSETGVVVKQFDPIEFTLAKRLERGLNINLDHKSFFTEMIEEHDA